MKKKIDTKTIEVIKTEIVNIIAISIIEETINPIEIKKRDKSIIDSAQDQINKQDMLALQKDTQIKENNQQNKEKSSDQ